jgi:hypothetical protein
MQVERNGMTYKYEQYLKQLCCNCFGKISEKKEFLIPKSDKCTNGNISNSLRNRVSW